MDIEMLTIRGALIALIMILRLRDCPLYQAHAVKVSFPLVPEN
jgi:hypothetical protein